MSSNETGRVETAYHEAGHEVALYALGFEVGDTSIVSQGMTSGSVATPIPEVLADRLDILEYSDEGKEYARRQILVVFSGVRAVRLLTGRAYDPFSFDPFQVSDDDWSQLSLWLPMLGGTEEYGKIARQAQYEMDRILQDEWDAVRAVAEALLERERLDAAAVRSVLKEADCARDDALVRRLHLGVERDRLIERRFELREESAPEHEFKRLDKRLLDIDRELETLYPEEDA